MTKSTEAPPGDLEVRGQRPMWCDDFDTDLLRAVPETEEIVGDCADILLKTHGHKTWGTLNHPSVWGMTAYFGIGSPTKPEDYWTSDGVVTCTFLEALRDAWPHTLRIMVEYEPVWDAHALAGEFQDLMHHLRGRDFVDESDAESARRVVRHSLQSAVRRFRRAISNYPYIIRRLDE